MPLNIYLVSRPDEGTIYDRYKNFVVVSRNESIAKRVHPNGRSFLTTDGTGKMSWSRENEKDCKGEVGIRLEFSHSETWVVPEKVKDLKVVYLGIADNSVKKGVITASFVNG